MSIPPAPRRMAICVLLLLAPLAPAALPPSPTVDYTRVDLNPDRVGFWLGPMGVRALKHHGDEETKLEAQMQVTIVEEGSPADGLIKPGDVILGVAGKTLGYGDPRRPICNAIIEVENDGGDIALDIWSPAQKAPVGDLRSDKKVRYELEPAAARLPGELKVVRIPLARLGRYSETSPKDCERSANIIKNGIRFIREKDRGFGSVKINYFALLATGEKDDIEFCKKKMMEANMHVPTENIHHSMMDAGKASWGLGYTVALMAEYTLLTGDPTFVPALKTEARRVALAQDDNGLWYHNLFMPYLARGKTEGRVIGYGPVNATGLGCLQGIVLAKKAGISDPLVDEAIARGLNYFRQYVDNGRVGYGYSEPIPGEASNGKNSIAAVIFGNAGDFEAMRYFTKCSIEVRERAGGHCGGYLNQLWGGLGASIGSPEGAENYFRTRRWFETSVRGWDGSFRYQFSDGTTYGEGTYGANTGAYLLSYLTPRRGLQILGKSVPETEYLSKKELAETLYSTRHFLEKGDELPDMTAIKTSDLPDEEIYALLGNWATGLRERAGYILRDRQPADVVSRIIAILGGEDQRAVYGAACYLRLLRKGEKLTPREEMERRNAFADQMAGAATDALLRTKNDFLANQLANGIGSVPPDKVAALLERIENSESQNRGLDALMFRSTFGERRTKIHPLEIVREKGIDPSLAVRWARLSALSGGETWMLEPLVEHASPGEIVMLLEPLMRNAEFAANIWTTAYFTKNRISEAREMIGKDLLGSKPDLGFVLKAAEAYGGNLKSLLPALYEKRANTDPRRTPDLKILTDIINVIANDNDNEPAPMVSIRDLLAADLAKHLAGKSPAQKAELLRGTLASLSSTDEIYHGLLLDEYAKIDPAAAFPFLINALGPPDNFRRRAAIDIAAATYPLATWLERLKSQGDSPQTQAGILHALRKIGKGINPAIPLLFLESEEFHVRQAAILLLGDIGAPSHAAPIAALLNEADRSETAAIEEAIAAIHKRTPLDRAFFQTHAEDLGKHHVNPTTEPELLYRENMITSDLPGSAGLRIMALSDDPSLLAPFQSTARYRSLVTKVMILATPLKIARDGSLDPAALAEFPIDSLAAILVPAIELGQIEKNLEKPLARYLLERAKTEKRVGDVAQKFLDRLKDAPQ